jgi:hypothetical protein
MMLNLERSFTPETYHQHLKEQKCYPSLKNLISSQIDFFNWWKNSNTNFIIRHSKSHKKFKVSNYEGTTYFSSDNEACVSFYESIFQNPIRIKNDLFQFFKENQLKVGIKVDKELGFKTGMANGICRKNELKLSHYLDAASNLTNEDSIKKRSAIYLSPLNIFLTPNPNKFEHTINGYSLYDIGEDALIKEHLHSCLIEDIISKEDGKLAYRLYCKMCELDFEEQMKKISSMKRKSIQIEFKRKHKKMNKSEIKPAYSLRETSSIKAEDVLAKGIVYRRNFILKKNYIGSGLNIQIVNKDGIPQFTYNHDTLLEQLGTRITGLPCWDRYGYYTKSGSALPNFCIGLRGIKIHSVRS